MCLYYIQQKWGRDKWEQTVDRLPLPSGQRFTRCVCKAAPVLFSEAMAPKRMALSVPLCGPPAAVCWFLPYSCFVRHHGAPCHEQIASSELGARWVVNTFNWLRNRPLASLCPPAVVIGAVRLQSVLTRAFPFSRSAPPHSKLPGPLRNFTGLSSAPCEAGIVEKTDPCKRQRRAAGRRGHDTFWSCQHPSPSAEALSPCCPVQQPLATHGYWALEMCTLSPWNAMLA